MQHSESTKGGPPSSAARPPGSAVRVAPPQALTELQETLAVIEDCTDVMKALMEEHSKLNDTCAGIHRNKQYGCSRFIMLSRNVRVAEGKVQEEVGNLRRVEHTRTQLLGTLAQARQDVAAADGQASSMVGQLYKLRAEEKSIQKELGECAQRLSEHQKELPTVQDTLSQLDSHHLALKQRLVTCQSDLKRCDRALQTYYTEYKSVVDLMSAHFGCKLVVEFHRHFDDAAGTDGAGKTKSDGAGETNSGQPSASDQPTSANDTSAEDKGHTDQPSSSEPTEEEEEEKNAPKNKPSRSSSTPGSPEKRFPSLYNGIFLSVVKTETDAEGQTKAVVTDCNAVPFQLCPNQDSSSSSPQKCSECSRLRRMHKELHRTAVKCIKRYMQSNAVRRRIVTVALPDVATRRETAQTRAAFLTEHIALLRDQQLPGLGRRQTQLGEELLSVQDRRDAVRADLVAHRRKVSSLERVLQSTTARVRTMRENVTVLQREQQAHLRQLRRYSKQQLTIDAVVGRSQTKVLTLYQRLLSVDAGLMDALERFHKEGSWREQQQRQPSPSSGGGSGASTVQNSSQQRNASSLSSTVDSASGRIVLGRARAVSVGASPTNLPTAQDGPLLSFLTVPCFGMYTRFSQLASLWSVRLWAQSVLGAAQTSGGGGGGDGHCAARYFPTGSPAFLTVTNALLLCHFAYLGPMANPQAAERANLCVELSEVLACRLIPLTGPDSPQPAFLFQQSQDTLALETAASDADAGCRDSDGVDVQVPSAAAAGPDNAFEAELPRVAGGSQELTSAVVVVGEPQVAVVGDERKRTPSEPTRSEPFAVLMLYLSAGHTNRLKAARASPLMGATSLESSVWQIGGPTGEQEPVETSVDIREMASVPGVSEYLNESDAIVSPKGSPQGTGRIPSVTSGRILSMVGNVTAGDAISAQDAVTRGESRDLQDGVDGTRSDRDSAGDGDDEGQEGEHRAPARRLGQSDYLLHNLSIISHALSRDPASVQPSERCADGQTPLAQSGASRSMYRHFIAQYVEQVMLADSSFARYRGAWQRARLAGSDVDLIAVFLHVLLGQIGEHTGSDGTQVHSAPSEYEGLPQGFVDSDNTLANSSDTQHSSKGGQEAGVRDSLPMPPAPSLAKAVFTCNVPLLCASQKFAFKGSYFTGGSDGESKEHHTTANTPPGDADVDGPTIVITSTEVEGSVVDQRQAYCNHSPQEFDEQSVCQFLAFLLGQTQRTPPSGSSTDGESSEPQLDAPHTLQDLYRCDTRTQVVLPASSDCPSLCPGFVAFLFWRLLRVQADCGVHFSSMVVQRISDLADPAPSPEGSPLPPTGDHHSVDAGGAAGQLQDSGLSLREQTAVYTALNKMRLGLLRHLKPSDERWAALVEVVRKHCTSCPIHDAPAQSGEGQNSTTPAQSSAHDAQNEHSPATSTSSPADSLTPTTTTTATTTTAVTTPQSPVGGRLGRLPEPGEALPRDACPLCTVLSTSVGKAVGFSPVVGFQVSWRDVDVWVRATVRNACLDHLQQANPPPGTDSSTPSQSKQRGESAKPQNVTGGSTQGGAGGVNTQPAPSQLSLDTQQDENGDDELASPCTEGFSVQLSLHGRAQPPVPLVMLRHWVGLFRFIANALRSDSPTRQEPAAGGAGDHTARPEEGKTTVHNHDSNPSVQGDSQDGKEGGQGDSAGHEAGPPTPQEPPSSSSGDRDPLPLNEIASCLRHDSRVLTVVGPARCLREVARLVHVRRATLQRNAARKPIVGPARSDSPSTPPPSRPPSKQGPSGSQPAKPRETRGKSGIWSSLTGLFFRNGARRGSKHKGGKKPAPPSPTTPPVKGRERGNSLGMLIDLERQQERALRGDGPSQEAKSGVVVLPPPLRRSSFLHPAVPRDETLLTVLTGDDSSLLLGGDGKSVTTWTSNSGGQAGSDLSHVPRTFTSVLPVGQLKRMIGLLPIKFRLSPWGVAYDMQRHGASLSNVYRCVLCSKPAYGSINGLSSTGDGDASPSSQRDGSADEVFGSTATSFDTVLNRTLQNKMGPRSQGTAGCTFVVVRDTRGCVFGGFASSVWSNSRTSYYGDRKSFVFMQMSTHSFIYRVARRYVREFWEGKKLQPNESSDSTATAPPEWSEGSLGDKNGPDTQPEEERDTSVSDLSEGEMASILRNWPYFQRAGEQPKPGTVHPTFHMIPRELFVWRWSGNNKFLQLADRDRIAMGGGGQGAAWMLDRQLAVGNSNACMTFGSPCLASGRRFRCATLQIWKEFSMF